MLQKLLILLLMVGISDAAQAEAPYRRTTVVKAEYAAQVVPAPEVPRACFRVAHDPWIGRDKVVDHALTAFVLAAAVDGLTHAHSQDAEMRVFWWNAGFWTGNELKDAVLPWEKAGWIGGDGFSYKDLLWSLAGAGLALTVF